MGNEVTIHLIRHEKTEANLKKKYIGWTDESIITTEQEFVVPIRADEVFGSDLRRCMETAKRYFPNAPYHSYKGLRELNFGDFEMKTYEELKNIQMYRNWIDEPERITPPNGEYYLEFWNRVAQSFHQIVSKDGHYTFIVHGGVIRTLLSKFAPTKLDFQEIYVSHRTIYTLYWSDYTAMQGGKRCELLSEAPIMAKDNL